MKKDMTNRSVADVVLRCKRINMMTEEVNINNQTVSLLIKTESFDSVLSFIK